MRHMTRAELILLLQTVLATILLATMTTATAEFYRWIDEKGLVTYSNVPPPTGARVREVVVVEEERAPTATELRTRQILEDAERERRQSGADLSTEGIGAPVYLYGMPNTAARDASPVPDGVARPMDALPSGSGMPGTGAPRTNAAARDPCLLSADPRCYELNARSYDPYIGYTPAGDVPSYAVGTTADSSSTGAVGPGIETAARTVQSAPSSSRLLGLPPGTPVQPLTRSGSRPATPRD